LASQIHGVIVNNNAAHSSACFKSLNFHKNLLVRNLV